MSSFLQIWEHLCYTDEHHGPISGHPLLREFDAFLGDPRAPPIDTWRESAEQNSVTPRTQEAPARPASTATTPPNNRKRAAPTSGPSNNPQPKKARSDVRPEAVPLTESGDDAAEDEGEASVNNAVEEEGEASAPLPATDDAGEPSQVSTVADPSDPDVNTELPESLRALDEQYRRRFKPRARPRPAPWRASQITEKAANTFHDAAAPIALTASELKKDSIAKHLKDFETKFLEEALKDYGINAVTEIAIKLISGRTYLVWNSMEDETTSDEALKRELIRQWVRD